ncbi:MAG: FMN-binding protein [Myxococcota bacterium]|nr:FMN-binding protein [Myxococcota bacterium]
MSSSWVSVTSSRSTHRFGIPGALLACLAFASADPAGAKVFFAQDEALERAFPGADRVEETNYILKSAQVDAIEKGARARLPGELLTIFTGWKDGRVLGYAQIEIHQVRTLPEAFMIVLSPTGEVTRVLVLAFYEPLGYLPRERWYEQFLGVSKKDDLRLGWDIHGVSGATLSARAATASVRRFLAAYDVLIAEPGKSADESPSLPQAKPSAE